MQLKYLFIIVILIVILFFGYHKLDDKVTEDQYSWSNNIFSTNFDAGESESKDGAALNTTSTNKSNVVEEPINKNLDYSSSSHIQQEKPLNAVVPYDDVILKEEDTKLNLGNEGSLEPQLDDKVIEEQYRWHNNILTTMFYAGEPGSNDQAAWNTNFTKKYGGVDDPIHRNLYYPSSFIPKENPFYAAVPYDDFTIKGERRENSKQIPWYDGSLGQNQSYIKNRWVEVKYMETICYAQLEDCGPVASGHLECDDFDYVFGSAKQSTKYPKGGNILGLDISPAMSSCLGMEDPTDLIFGHKDDYTSWRFINQKDVPDGPWKKIITTSQIDWND